jgi:hypothetical protein
VKWKVLIESLGLKLQVKRGATVTEEMYVTFISSSPQMNGSFLVERSQLEMSAGEGEEEEEDKIIHLPMTEVIMNLPISLALICCSMKTTLSLAFLANSPLN